MTTHRHRANLFACTACGALVHGPNGCKPQPLGNLTPLPCPACGRDAIYCSGIDRYVHADRRRPNENCWLLCVQGNANAEIHRANDSYLARRPRRRGSAA